MRKQRPARSILPERTEQREKISASPATSRRREKTASKRPHRTGGRQNFLRAGLAVVAGRSVGALSRRLHLGGGTSIVGTVAERIYPEIIPHLAAQLEHGSIVITGTNGKTTTSSFIADILQDGGLRVWRNREGSNLARGVASALVIRARPNGRLRRAGRAISIFEVDEAAVPRLTPALAPRVIVFTNLFRDQLDRYGEVQGIVTRWQETIRQLPASTTLVLNADDPTIALLGEGFAGRVIYYGIDDPALDLLQQENDKERHQVIDTRTCPECGSEYIYDMRFYSHMGHYACPNGHVRRPQPDVSATRIQTDSFDRHRVTLSQGGAKHEIIVPLPGLYNIYNALAAACAAQAINSDWQPIISGIEQFKPVFGRGERVQAEGRTLRLLLAKNPTGFNEVLRTLFSDDNARHVLFVLNDHTADGRDVSWIWDVDFERAVGQTRQLVISGTRALDLALRLKYAGIAEEEMLIVPAAALRALQTARPVRGMRKRSETREKKFVAETQAYGLKSALDLAIQRTPVGETLFIVPTYTGLLEIHRELEQRGLTSHYWEGKDV